MQIREIKRRLNGTSQTFFCELLYRSGETMVIRFQATEDPYAAVAHTSEGYYWLGRHYLMYKMCDQFGGLVGYRFDVCKDVRFGHDAVEWTDLYLDAFLSPAGDFRILDEAEVAEAVARGELSQTDQVIIARTRALLEAEHAEILREAAALRQLAGRAG